MVNRPQTGIVGLPGWGGRPRRGSGGAYLAPEEVGIGLKRLNSQSLDAVTLRSICLKSSALSGSQILRRFRCPLMMHQVLTYQTNRHVSGFARGPPDEERDSGCRPWRKNKSVA